MIVYMKRNAKILVFLLSGLILISSCNDNDEASPYADVIARPPFAKLTDSIRMEPSNDELYFRRAVLLNENGESLPALADFRKAWSLKKQEKYALGISTILAEDKPSEAISFLHDALKELPRSTLLRLSLVHSYDALNKTDEALAVCESILKENPTQVDVLKISADLLEKKGRVAEAIASLEKAYRLTPFDVQLNYMLALKYAEVKNNRVLSLCDSLIKADSLNMHAEPYYYKGIYYANINEKPKAFEMFDKAIRQDYTFLESYVEKGSLLFDMKKYNEALKVFNLLLTISPQYPDSYYWIAKCQQALGLKEEAKLNYQRAYGLDNTFRAAKDSADKLK